MSGRARIPIETRQQALIQQVRPALPRAGKVSLRKWDAGWVGYRRGALNDAVPRAGTVRRENRDNTDRKSRHLGTSCALFLFFEPHHKTQLLPSRGAPQSLGCTLFAVAYNYSPFEDPAQGGGSIAMAVSSGRYRHPQDSPYSKAFQYVSPCSLSLAAG